MSNSPNFFPLLKKALRSYEERWATFSAIALVTVGLGTILQLWITKWVNFYYAGNIITEAKTAEVVKVPFDIALKSELVGGIGGGLIASLLGLIMVASTIHLLKSKKTKFLEALIFGIKNLWKFILTALYVLWYTLGWLLLLIIGFFMLTFLSKFSKYGLTAVVGKDFEIDPMRETVAGVIREMSTGASGVVNLILIILGIIVFFVVVYRSIKATFAYFALLDTAKTGPIKAVKKSVRAVTGNFWLVLFYLLLLSLSLSIIMGIIGLAATKAAAGTPAAAYVENGVPILLTIVFVPIMVAFEYLFYQALKK